MYKIKRKNKAVEYKWRDRYANLHPPKTMNTKHLFYTWLMIWNHACPEKLRIWAKHKYQFDLKIYTKKYMLTSFQKLYYELKRRNDLGYKMKKVLLKIEGYYHKESKCIK